MNVAISESGEAAVDQIRAVPATNSMRAGG
jgi:hypothetical protein